MKIAVIRTTLNKGSGQAVHIRETSRQLMSRGYDIQVFCRHVFEDMGDIPVTVVDDPLKDLPFVRHLSFAFSLVGKVQDFDLVHTQYHPGVFAGCVSHFLKEKPHVFTYHGFAPVNVWGSGRQMLKMIDHRVGTFLAARYGIDYALTVSEYLKRELAEKYLFPSERILVCYNGVDLERFSPHVSGESIRDHFKLGSKPVVLFLGRLVPYKGVEFMLQAAPLILREVPDAYFLVGGASRHDTLKISRLLADQRVRERFIFMGYVPDGEVAQLYASCDVFCFPSLWEGFGIPLAEAQAVGKPVVAFNNCAVPEVVEDQRTGILVPPRNWRKLAKSVVFLLKNRDVAYVMGKAGRERVGRLFTWDRVAKVVETAYEKAVEYHGVRC